MSGWRIRCWAPMAALVLAGCTANAVHVGKYEPQELGMTVVPTVGKDRARLAVGVGLADLDRMYTGVPTTHRMLQVNLPLGRIVDGAARAAFEREFDEVVPPQPSSAVPLRVEIGAIRFDVRDDFQSPGGSPLLPHYDVAGRMMFEVSVIDANGTERWTGDYDAGWQAWIEPPPANPASPRPFDPGAWGAGLQKMAHEQAARLTSQAARDIRAWVRAERVRERSL